MAKWKYRPHRGSLADAMAEAVELSGREAVLRHIGRVDAWSGFNPELVEITPYGVGNPPHRDDRIGWENVHIISHHGYGVIGFCDVPLTESVQRPSGEAGE